MNVSIFGRFGWKRHIYAPKSRGFVATIEKNYNVIKCLKY